MPKGNRSQSAPASENRLPRGPEKKIGPFPAGIGVAIWINSIQTDEGPRKIRSITLSPRRFFDRDAGQWRDSGSYHPGDIPALIFALQKAQEYIFTTPIPGQRDEQEEPAGKTPF